MSKLIIKVISFIIFSATSIISYSKESPSDKAYFFLTEGTGGEALKGITSSKNLKKFLAGIGQTTKQKIELTKNPTDEKVNDEIYRYSYEGMSVIIYVSNIDKKIIVADAIITSAKWPVTYGLKVGSSRSDVESTLGKSMGKSKNKWVYGDGAEMVVINFDQDQKIKSIHWSVDIE